MIFSDGTWGRSGRWNRRADCNVMKRRRIAGSHLPQARGDIDREVKRSRPFNNIFSSIFVYVDYLYLVC
jgi:hypothetical protein